MCIYIYIYPPLEVQRPIMHPSEAPPAPTNPVGLLRRQGVRVSRLVVDLQASHRPRVKVRLNVLWFISGLVGLFLRPVSLAYKSVWSCLFFRTVQSRSVCESVLLVLVASQYIVIVSLRVCEMLVGPRRAGSRIQDGRQDRPKRVQEPPRAAQDPPRPSQEGPRAPKSDPRPSQ